MAPGMLACSHASASYSPGCTCQHTSLPQQQRQQFAAFLCWRSSSRSSRLRARLCPKLTADLQDVIVGGAVLTAVSAALYNGLKGERQVCDLCQGVGGAKCFACEGSGRMESGVKEEAQARKRDFVGRVSDGNSCRVCGGSGMNLCSKCKGSGYL